MNSSDVHVFNKVAKSLSFTAAAREVGTSRSSVSKQISRLERSLGVVLLNRSTRSVSLTEAGRILFQNTSRVDQIIAQAVNDIRAAELEPTGTVKLSIPSSLGRQLLPSLISEFQRAWPNIRIKVHGDDSSVDLIGDGYDLAI
ncbi:MAG: LysR family transcriptional regulator, partial [Woeseiaceae bacterium]|nr:LysR family transcriptional regulator [Woeseiaceae bacterium]